VDIVFKENHLLSISLLQISMKHFGELISSVVVHSAT